MGSHWYLYGVPGSSNMPIVVIFLDPIHQSRPKIGPICRNHNIMLKIVFFLVPTDQVPLENTQTEFE